MKTRLLGAAVIVGALFAVHALRADEAKDSAGKCPVSGKAASKDHAADFEGGKVYFCCDNCPAEFAKDSAKYAAKAHLQMVATGQLVQSACPLTGKPVNPAQSVEIDGVKVGFCCGNCKGKVAKMSADDQVEAVFKDVSKGYKLADKK